MDPKQKQFSIWYVFVALWALMLIQIFVAPLFNPTEIPYSEFKAAVTADKVEEVSISPSVIHGRMKPEPDSAKGSPPVAKDGRVFDTVRVEDPDLVRDLGTHHVKVTGVIESTFVRDLLSWVVPIALFVGVWLFLLRRMGQGQGGFMTVGRSKAKIYMEKEVKVSFADAAGVDEAKEELQEVIEFLKTPEKFRRLGGKIPKGILLVGPPGTGKTLLAKAVAGEAAVPFFSTSGSEFVEMFVGVGAARVRDLFIQAKEKAPCIIFIDELDALGKARGMGPMAHEEREQTLNQLLSEMDGFDPRVGVILMAATNRPEILDPALLRAGRFDRHVLVDRPDKAGRLAILKIHARSVKLASEADLEAIAIMTPGFVGADLANIINEAALLAVRRDKDKIELADLQEAVERVIAGLEKKNRVLNPAEKERVAHHEVGHALVALSIPGTDTVQKISIIPRGIAALGYTIQLPTEDRFLMTKSELENKIAVLLGGRVAEEIIYREVSTGAQDDLLKATDIAKSMVKAYGMSEKLGQISFERERQPLFLQTGQPQPPGDYSEETSREIDCEVRRIIDEQYARVRTLLDKRQDALREAAALLLGKETMTGEDLKVIMAKSGARQ
ncbi:MAG: ATP-dependent metallopeptidase FtsH/Yme1/Tma family protein [Nitrospirae bacterium]|nr:ATP-dependent metallopeptidase FtsH/Yme1/Tma family protein [Nitrospirota bacterium]